MLLPFFNWAQNSAVSNAILASWWAGALINICHLLSLVFFIGAMLIINLRLLGVGITETPLPQVAAEARPWMLGGFTGLALTGVLQFMSLATRNYYNFNFWFKMTFLLISLIYTFTIWQRVIFNDKTRSETGKAKLVGIVSIGLWGCVVIAGRLIGLT
jgi:Family of unknown function (DUF6644)